MLFRRSLPLGFLVVLLATAPASARGKSALFPSLKATVGKDRQAQRVERRVRGIETSLIGSGHASEHARQRAVRHQMAQRRARKRATRAARNRRLTPNNSFVDPAVGGFWEPGVKLPIVAINSTLMHTGKVLFFAYPWRPGRPDPDNPGESLVDPGYADAYVFNPATGTSKRVDPPTNPDTGKPAYIFCAGTSTLPDGRVLVVGGDVGDPTAKQNHGLNTVFTFDPVTETWQTHQRTRQGRWYPSQLEMADGRTVILAGLPNTTDPDWPDKINKDIEIFSPDGSLQKLDSVRADIDQQPGATLPAGHAPITGQYPHMFWLPSGKALIAGPRKTDSWVFNPPTAGQDDASVEDRPDLPEFREWASAALLPGTSAAGSTRVMLFGGSAKDDFDPDRGTWPARKTTTVYDDATPSWTAGPDMHVARSFSNSVLLPDGKVAIVGGGKGEDSSKELYRWEYVEANKRIDIYDPAKNTFTFGNAQAEARTYHSSAILLPDGRVMSAGDDINGPTGPDSGVKTDTAEMWSPPYLFDDDGTKADRPQISSAPTVINYDKPFVAGTPDAIASAVLVAPGASTHDTDMSQRVVPLAPPDGAPNAVNLMAPANANLAPPGYYMLFLLDADGVPSVAKFVRLEPAEPVVLPPPPTPTPTAAPTTEPGVTPTPAPSVTVTPTPEPKPFKLTLKAARPKYTTLKKTGKLTVRLTLTGAGEVDLSTALERARKLGRVPLLPIARTRKLDFAAPTTGTVTIKLTARGRKLLPRKGAVTIRLTATASREDGPDVHARLRLKLRR